MSFEEGSETGWPQEVRADSEFGELRVCAVGIPYTIEFTDGSWVQRHYHWIDDECEALKSILSEFGTEVIEPERITVEAFHRRYPLNPRRYGCSQVFPRDYFACVGDRCMLIGCRPSPAFTYGPGCDRVELPGSTTFDRGTVEPMVEGGDVVILGGNIVVGHSSNVSSISNAQGCDWIRRQTGRGVTFVGMPDEFVHLDMALSVVNEKTVICSDNLVLPVSVTRNLDVISIPSIEARKGLVNGLALSPDVYVTPVIGGNPCRQIVSGLKETGVEVVELEYTKHLRMLGGIRCSTAAFVRRNISPAL